MSYSHTTNLKHFSGKDLFSIKICSNLSKVQTPGFTLIFKLRYSPSKPGTSISLPGGTHPINQVTKKLLIKVFLAISCTQYYLTPN